MRAHSLLALLALLAAAPECTAWTQKKGAGISQQRGKGGTQAPQPADVVLDDTVVHGDESGGCTQTLIGLSGSAGGGFGAVWRDMREGNLGLYCGSMGADGALRAGDRAIHEPRTTRMLDPASALAKDGSGGVAFVMTFMDKNEVHVRFFGPDGRFQGPHRGVVTGGTIGKAPKGGNPAEYRPAIAAWPAGGAAVVWTQGGKVQLQLYDGRYAPRGELVVVGAAAGGSGRGRGPATGGGALVACGAGSRALVVWAGAKGNRAAPVTARGSVGAEVDAGPGTALRLLADSTGGYWLLVLDSGVYSVRRLDANGALRGDDARPVKNSLASADLALWDGGLALLAQERAGRGELGGVQRGSAPVLHLFDRDFAAQGPPLEVLPGGADAGLGAQVAASGAGLLVAWTELGGSDADVWMRPVAVEGDAPRLGDARRLNQDLVSSNQSHPDADAAGDFAVVAWEDSRAGDRAVYARVVRAKGELAGEYRLPVPVGDERRRDEERVSWPVACVRADGTFLSAWHANQGRTAELRFQVLSAEGRPAAAAAALDPGQATDGRSPVAVCRAAGGWLAVWARAGGGVFGRFVGADGRPSRSPSAISKASMAEARNVSVAALDDGRFLVAWDEKEARRSAPRLFGRFLDASYQPAGEVLAFEATEARSDWDPAVAPADRDGFALAWCSGGESDMSRDVVMRVFDKRGKPVSQVVPITVQIREQDFPELVRLADGDWAVAWEDDLSNYDHGYVRRVPQSLRKLGPVVALNQRESPRVEARSRPQIAAFGDGLIAAWGDRRRSQGWDVFVRVLGGRFDKGK